MRCACTVLAALLATATGVARAQMVQAVPGVLGTDPVSTLSAHLRALAANPRNLSALLGAGQAAIDVGDPNAALGFFARADEIDPRNGAVKAGLASALVELEKPDDALRLFGEAATLGVSEGVLARDRGLAYDLRGDNRRAQRDYALALRNAPDDEVTRRFALSLGISGDRGQALTLLDPLLRRQDQGAWRARAFILAMNNDVSGANAIARQVMPAGLAGTMAPFLARLARLNPAERAHAVNFGTMPSDGQAFASVQMGDPFRPIGGTGSGRSPGEGLIPAGAPLGRTTIAAGPPARPPERRPVIVTDTASRSAVVSPGFSVPASTNPPARLGTRIGTRIAAVDPAKLPPEARGDLSASTTRVTAMTSLPPPDAARPAATPAAVASPAIERVLPVVQPASSATLSTPLPPPPPVEADPGLAAPVARVMGPPAEQSATATAPFETVARPVPNIAVPVVTAAATAPAGRLASIIAGLQTEVESAPVALPTAAEVRAAQRAAVRKAALATEAAAAAQLAKDEKAKEAAAAKANPARLWVQVATGSNERGLGITWRRIREGSAAALKPYGGYSVAYKATNRILAGPVKSSADARALINALAKAGVSATTYSSEAGQEVVKLGAK